MPLHQLSHQKCEKMAKRESDAVAAVSPKRRKSAPNASTPIAPKVDDTRIAKVNALLPPICLIEELPCEAHHLETIVEGRRAIERVFDGEVGQSRPCYPARAYSSLRIIGPQDDRLVVIVGPCSVHDGKAAREYAHTAWSCFGPRTEFVAISAVDCVDASCLSGGS